MQASLDSKLLILASQSHLYIFSRGSASSNIHFPICSYIFPIPRPSNCCISISSSSVSASVHCRPRLQTFIARLTAIKSTVDSWRNNCRAKGQLDAVLRCETSMEKDGKGGVSFGDFGRCGDFGYPIGSMYAIYGNMYHQYTPVMLAYIYIYQHHGSVMGMTSNMLKPEKLGSWNLKPPAGNPSFFSSGGWTPKKNCWNKPGNKNAIRQNVFDQEITFQQDVLVYCCWL